MIKNDARGTLEIKSKIAMAKTALNEKKNLFKSDLYLRKEFLKCYIMNRV
jgi:hypothetical protein